MIHRAQKTKQNSLYYLIHVGLSTPSSTSTNSVHDWSSDTSKGKHVHICIIVSDKGCGWVPLVVSDKRRGWVPLVVINKGWGWVPLIVSDKGCGWVPLEAWWWWSLRFQQVGRRLRVGITTVTYPRCHDSNCVGGCLEGLSGDRPANWNSACVGRWKFYLFPKDTSPNKDTLVSTSCLSALAASALCLGIDVKVFSTDPSQSYGQILHCCNSLDLQQVSILIKYIRGTHPHPLSLTTRGTQPHPLSLTTRGTQPHPLSLTTRGTQPHPLSLTTRGTHPHPLSLTTRGTHFHPLLLTTRGTHPHPLSQTATETHPQVIGEIDHHYHPL